MRRMAKHGTSASVTIQVLERAFALLDLLAAHQDPVSLKEISEQTGLHPSTAHRILNDLTIGRFVDRPEAGSYRLGMRLLELGNLVKARLDVRDAALGADARAAQADPPAGEPVDAPGRRDRLHRAHLQRALGHAGRARHRRPRAAAPDVGRQAVPGARRCAARARLCRRAPAWPGHTRNSITELPALERELARVQPVRHRARRRGARARRALHGRRHLRRPGQARRRPVDLGAGGPARGSAGWSGCGRPQRRSPRRSATAPDTPSATVSFGELASTPAARPATAAGTGARSACGAALG